MFRQPKIQQHELLSIPRKQKDEKISLSSIHSLKKQLLKDFIEPYLKLKPIGLNLRIFIQQTITLLCMHYQQLQDLENCLIEKQQNFDLYDLQPSKTPYSEGLNRAYEGLRNLYCDSDKVKQIFPDFNLFLVQTMIREICHEIINPLPHLNPEKLQSSRGVNTPESQPILNLPVEIERLVSSYLDNKASKAFSLTCKHAYFLHKKTRDVAENIFYIVRDLHSSNHKKFVAENNVKLFISLYQAIEFSLSIPINNQTNFPIYAVRYKGNIHCLEFLIETKVNLGSIQRVVWEKNDFENNYSRTERGLTLIYASVPSKSLLFLGSSSLFSHEQFASYTDMTSPLEKHLDKDAKGEAKQAHTQQKEKLKSKSRCVIS